jgi:hypothetical protein
MKLASTLLLGLNLGATMASDKNLHLRGGGEEYVRRLTLTNTTDAPSLSSAPTTGEPAAAPSKKPTIAQGPTFNPTLEPCSANVLVPIGYYDDYDWIELPECVQEAGELFDYR